jgi:predicted site-specific integrase-resolvase
VAQRSEWARILDCDASSLYRAERAGLLIAAKTKGGKVLYTKESILEWLGLEQVVTAPVPATSRLQAAAK